MLEEADEDMVKKKSLKDEREHKRGLVILEYAHVWKTTEVEVLLGSRVTTERQRAEGRGE